MAPKSEKMRQTLKMAKKENGAKRKKGAKLNEQKAKNGAKPFPCEAVVPSLKSIGGE